MNAVKLVALDRFSCGTGVGHYSPGAVITDTETWPDGMLQERLARGSVAYVPVNDAPVDDTVGAPVDDTVGAPVDDTVGAPVDDTSTANETDPVADVQEEVVPENAPASTETESQTPRNTRRR
jgi:hypothetical protein